MRRAAVVAAAAGALAVSTMGVGSCGENDVDVHGRTEGPATIIDMPNHFSSVAQKCDGLGHRVYIADHGNSGNGGSAPFVINDPSCPGGTGR